jgi:hypothetical protein
MNALELVAIAAASLTGALLLWPLLAYLRFRALERRVADLQELAHTFADASVRLSSAMANTVATPVPAPVRAEPSRRALLHAARKQLDAGAKVERVSVTLGLRPDELRLMEIGRQRNVAAVPASISG